MNAQPQSLRTAVSALCPDIQARVTARGGLKVQDRQLWWELSCCVLSSQVPYAMAVAAANRIAETGLLMLHGDKDVEQIRVALSKLLHTPLIYENSARKYRFPELRAKQLSKGWAAVWEEGGSLMRIINAMSEDPWALRKWLVTRIPGLGPKQASMFLRNIGASYDLAVLDRHVLNYMSSVGLTDTMPRSIGSLSAYRRHEYTLERHADEFGYPVGMVDWAIWIVMRAVGNSDAKRAV
ncbi:MAG: DNA lyase [Magnetococcales bacterium]|nr:DNA lyase [Magnetococcales bacterium]